MNRRSFLHAAAAIPALGALAHVPALARGPALASLPGLTRFKVGDISVTALSDGYVDMALALFPRTPEADGKAALAASPQEKPLRAAVNAFLVETDGKRVLVDAGGLASVFPSLGKLPSNLDAAGVASGSIDAVAMTHLHVDHIGALTNGDGSARFGDAEVIIAEEEYAFWTNPGLLSNAGADFKPFVEAAQRAISPYAKRTTRVSGEKEVIKGMTMIPAFGHTPGHSMVRLSSGGEQLLIWGDIIHAPSLQFANPEWTIVFDADADAAAASRKRVLDMAAADRLPVMGAHLAFPGCGYVTKAAKGYRYDAAEYDFDA
jgi:glyoxylase-like metal-dependent hydrolase (beta-lactamase superfamily II)